MIQLLQPPPIQYGQFSLHGRVFTWEPDEPFVTKMLDGSVDTDLTRQTPGFINRIQRYGLQNNYPQTLWDEQSILYSLLLKIPLELRPKFFKQNASASHMALQKVNVHTAPVPHGLATAAGFPHVAEDDPDLPVKLAQQTPDKWLATLKKWIDADPANRKTKTAAGPAFWWALHSVALNPVPSTPLSFVGKWKGMFPCRKCRIGASIYFARHPVPDWSSFAKWASDLHDYVTAKKNR